MVEVSASVRGLVSALVARFKILKEGDKVRLRGQMRGVYYTVVADSFLESYEWVVDVSSTEYFRLERQPFDIGVPARGLTHGSIVRVKDKYYEVLAYPSLLDDQAGLHPVLPESFGLPEI